MCSLGRLFVPPCACAGAVGRLVVYVFFVCVSVGSVACDVGCGLVFMDVCLVGCVLVRLSGYVRPAGCYYTNPHLLVVGCVGVVFVCARWLVCDLCVCAWPACFCVDLFGCVVLVGVAVVCLYGCCCGCLVGGLVVYMVGCGFNSVVVCVCLGVWSCVLWICSWGCLFLVGVPFSLLLLALA